MKTTEIIVLVLYFIMNLVAFIMYGVDKNYAKNDKWRIPEANLLIAAVFGVFGAFLGMQMFHHKTKKPKFYIGVPAIMIGEIIIASVVIYLLKFA